MPKLWQNNIKEGTVAALWKITEAEQELAALLQCIAPRQFHSRQRTLHWLASRVLLEEVLADMGVFRFSLDYDPFGRPCLDTGKLHLSLSHAGEYAAVAVSEKGPVGIDIEKVSPRVEKIHAKFMNEGELGLLGAEGRLEFMALVWSAKESLFKYYAEGELDFRRHLHVREVLSDRLRVEIEKDPYRKHLEVSYRFLGEYVFTVTMD